MILESEAGETIKGEPLTLAKKYAAYQRQVLVRRRRFPMTPAYALTDHLSQGQTLPAKIADIATPPTSETPSSACVPANRLQVDRALSTCTSRCLVARCNLP